MDLRQAAERVLDRARGAGAAEAEATAAEGETLEIGVRFGDVEKLKRARERWLAIRTFVGHSSALCSTKDLSPDALDRVAADCVDLSRATASDPFAGLPDDAPEGDGAVDLDLYDPLAETLSAERAIEIARSAESAALAADPRITNSEGAEFRAGSHRLVYATSRGLGDEYRSSYFSLSVVPVASSGGEMQRDYWYSSARKLDDLEPPGAVGRRAAERTLRRLGSRSVPTREVPVVFDPETAASLLGHFASAVSGTSIYRGTSFLADRLGEPLAPPFVTIVDDARLRAGLGSRPFDAEGLATRRNLLLAAGTLQSYLLDTYSARKLGLCSTASAVRSLGEPPSAGPSNLYLEKGSATPEEILRSVPRGLYVTELIGFGVNAVTGDYSRGAAGLWIEDGRLAFPVHEVTIAGNLLEMFRSIEMVGTDLEFRSSIAAPTIKIARMTVAGDG